MAATALPTMRTENSLRRTVLPVMRANRRDPPVYPVLRSVPPPSSTADENLMAVYGDAIREGMNVRSTVKASAPPPDQSDASWGRAVGEMIGRSVSQRFSGD